VWKETLTDLSGGQRSLLALSLILAMLLFKPAPMYILDEIDAALDLSHTQNIGNMIRTHFAKSQFIVVSLKQGLFNNANVIFRTKFVEVRACAGGGSRLALRAATSCRARAAPGRRRPPPSSRCRRPPSPTGPSAPTTRAAGQGRRTRPWRRRVKPTRF
jgi:ATPase subunit of ABC transporter with duplicated ATPase domains